MRFILPILLIITSIFLRFYRFSEFVMFLGDQGRDAIILKRIVTFEHFPAIGPPSSLGQIFLGPFYYYLIAPFLLLFNFSPVGPAFAVSIISIIGIAAIFLVVKKEVNSETALILLVLLTFSYVGIQSSRFSWNPNLLPVFSFFTLYFFYKTLTQKPKTYPLLFGSFLAFSIQLHHLALLLLLPLTITAIIQKSKIKKNLVFQKNSSLLISLMAFLFFSLPLLVFDLRHQFLNTKNLIKFFLEGNPTDHKGFMTKLLLTNQNFYNFVFQINFNPYLSLVISIFLALLIMKCLRNKYSLFLFINLFSFISYLIVFSFFNAPRNTHYYNLIYFSFFLLLSWILTYYSKNKIFKVATITVILVFYVFFNSKSLSYLFQKVEKSQIKIAENIADSLIRTNPQNPFQVVALPQLESEGHIRYFLEIKGKRPLPSDTLSEPQELYVLCFSKDPNRSIGGCQVLGNPQWQIASFKNAKISKIWTVEGIKIYKIIHQSSNS